MGHFCMRSYPAPRPSTGQGGRAEHPDPPKARRRLSCLASPCDIAVSAAKPVLPSRKQN